MTDKGERFIADRLEEIDVKKDRLTFEMGAGSLKSGRSASARETFYSQLPVSSLSRPSLLLSCYVIPPID